MKNAIVAGIALAIASPLAAQDMACPYNANMRLASRSSPLDSMSMNVGAATVKVCYSRPSLRGRTMLGADAVPFGQVWRTGANETTKLITTAPVMVGSIEVPAGMYALYTVPGASEWQVIVNKAHEQWGHERNYSAEVQAQELGRVTVTVERVATPVEMFTIRGEPGRNGPAHLILEWENQRIKVPVTAKR